MAEHILTVDQQNAVNVCGTNIAVSAAAGSGKTTVLTDRIVEMACKEDGFDLSKIIAVTFTVAAAESLKKKLHEKLNEKADEKGSTFITENLIKLDEAKISTTDSFCRDLIKKYHSVIGLEETPKIADENEINSLIVKCADDAIEEFSAKTDEPYFEKIYAVFSKTRTDSELSEFITALYKKINSYPDMLSALTKPIEKAKESLLLLYEHKIGFFDTEWGKILLSGLIDEISYVKNIALYLSKNINSPYLSSYVVLSSDLCESAERWLLWAKKGEIGKIKTEADLFNGKNMPRIRIPAEEKALKELLMKSLGTAKGAVSKYIDSYLDFSPDAIIGEIDESIKMSECAARLVECFLEKFTAAKRKKGICDFPDLSHMALDILTVKDENGIRVKSEIAKRISEDTDAVFVDEYQDTNYVQDMIFRMISNGKNLFIVGDPKQSIYGFRNAEPQIFTDYKNSYPKYNPECLSASGVSILLSENFRCDKNIIDFTNAVFEKVMDSKSKDSVYKDEDKLVFSKKAKYSADNKVEIVITGDKSEGVEKFIARKIKDIINGEILNDDGKKLTFSDIAILGRTKTNLVKIYNYLKEIGIPTSDYIDKSMSISPEYLFIDSIIGALINPLEDITLVGAMTSPVFRFTEDELFAIKKTSKEDLPFLKIVENAGEIAKEPLKTKIKSFLEKLSDIRSEMKYLSVSDTVFMIYQNLSVKEIYSAVSDKSGETLDFIMSCARKFDSQKTPTLDRFRDYLANSFAASDFEDNDEAVKIMTFHKSKGLEFPVVFLADAENSFNKDDTEEKWVFHRNEGVATDIVSESGESFYPSVIKNAIALTVEKDLKEEEKRILYVALTRGKNKVYIVASKNKNNSIFINSLSYLDTEAPHELKKSLIEKSKSHIEYILTALQGKTDFSDAGNFGQNYENEYLRVTSPDGYINTDDGINDDGLETQSEYLTFPFDSAKIISALDFEYENGQMLSLPEKLSVSQLLKSDPTRDELQIGSLYDLASKKSASLYSFIGTSMHKSMQFMNFENAEKDIESEISRLCEKKYITEDEKKVLDIPLIQNFFKSDIYAEIKKSRNVQREKRFNVIFDAKKLLGKSGDVLVQGVIDIYFDNPDNTVTVLDFKTDRVKPEDGEKILIERHKNQLLLYSEAISMMTGKKVSRMAIYSFALSKTIEIQTQ